MMNYEWKDLVPDYRLFANVGGLLEGLIGE